MTIPQTNPQSRDEFADLVADMGAALRPLGTPASPAARPSPRGPSAGGGGGQMWGPSARRDTSPLQLLVEAADHAHALLDRVGQLVADITGEAPVTPRQRAVPRAGGGLLPGIGHLAHEIETALTEVDRKLRELGAKIG